MTIEYQYTTEIVKRGAWHFLFRWGRKGLVGLAILAALSVLGLCLGINTWWTWLILCLPILLLLSWGAYVKRAAKVCDGMPDKTISVTFTDTSVHFHTSEHDSEIKWSLIKTLWTFKSEWLFFTYSDQHYTLIPTSVLDLEVRDFILKKASENKTKIM